MKIPMRIGADGMPASGLLATGDQAQLDAMLDGLESNICHSIIAAVHNGAIPLLKRGYHADELVILGFGSSITVEPFRNRRRSALRLWLRRVGLQLKILDERSYRDELAQIVIVDPDTYRIVHHFHLFTATTAAVPA